MKVLLAQLAITITTKRRLGTVASLYDLEQVILNDGPRANKLQSNVLKSILAETSPAPKDADADTNAETEATPTPKYKYAVTSTVIQNLDPPNTNSTGTSTTEDAAEHATNGDVTQAPTSGRRGMHSATGAYWNNSTDGMWTYKWDGADKRGCDVVLSVIWMQS